MQRSSVYFRLPTQETPAIQENHQIVQAGYRKTESSINCVLKASWEESSILLVYDGVDFSRVCINNDILLRQIVVAKHILVTIGEFQVSVVYLCAP